MPPSPLKFANDPRGYFDENEAAMAAVWRAAAEAEADRVFEVIASATSG